MLKLTSITVALLAFFLLRNENAMNLYQRLKRLFPASFSQQSQCNTSSLNTPIRMGILGASTIAQHAVIIPASRNKCDVIVTGIAARDPKRAMKYGKRHDIPHVYASYKALIKATDIDAVYIGIPTFYHYKYTMLAIKAGKHVLLEKPMTVSSKEAKEIEAQAKAAGVVIMEAFHYRFHPLFQRVIELVRHQKIIGDLLHLNVQIEFPALNAFLKSTWIGKYFSSQNEKETTEHEHRKQLDRWCYALDAIMNLCDKEANSTVKRASLNAVDSNILIHISDKNNKYTIPAEISTTKATLNLKWDLHILGERGSISITNFWFPSVYHSLTIHLFKNEIEEKYETHYGENDDYGITTFETQMRKFTQLCRIAMKNNNGGIVLAGISNMKIVDEVFRVAGVDQNSLELTES